jgi:hypothetical protein
MHKFVCGHRIADAIKFNLKEAGPTDLAVAYWGEGGANRLGLSKTNKSVRILCDLRSLACNPDELQTLLDNGATLRTSDGLHAKVYILSDRVVIGSANASINGLGSEGTNDKFEHEAAIETDDTQVRADVAEWFKRHWEKADSIDKALLDDIRPDWRRRRQQQTARIIENSNENLFLRLADNPLEFSEMRIRLGLFDEEADNDEAYSAAWQLLKRYYTKEEIEKRKYGKDSNRYPFYLNPNNLTFAIDDYLVNYWATRTEGSVLKEITSEGGIWRVTRTEEINVGGKRRSVILATEVGKVKGNKASIEDYRSLKSTLLNYFTKVSPQLSRDILLDFAEIPKEHPGLLDGIRVWAQKRRASR